MKQIQASKIKAGDFIPVGDGIVERVELVLTDADKGTTELLFGADLARLDLCSTEKLSCILNPRITK